MDSNSVATLVTACATAVYGIGTIFLCTNCGEIESNGTDTFRQRAMLKN